MKLEDLAIKLLFTYRRKVAGATMDRFQETSVRLLNTGTSKQVNYDLGRYQLQTAIHTYLKNVKLDCLILPPDPHPW